MTYGRCVVPGCSNLGHHLVPRVNSRKSLWIKAMKLEGQILKFKKPSVCKLHFKNTDYMDSDYVDTVKMKNRNLKRHAVPSIFPWNDEPPTKETFISQEETSSDSKSEMKNVESRANLLSNNDNTTDKLVSEIQPSSSLETDNDYEKDIPCNSSGVNKSHITQNMPFRYDFTPGPSNLPCEELSDTLIQDSLCVQESEKQQSSEQNKSFAEIEIDTRNVIEITETTVKQEKDIGNVKDTESVEIKQEKDLENYITFTEPCASCGHLPFYSIHSYKNEPNGVNFYTGLETFDKLMSVFKRLGDGVNSLDYVYEPPPDHLDPLEQFCMVLLILSRNREFEDVALTYRTSTKQVANIFITWIPFMALQWQTIKLGIDKKAVSYYMSLDDNNKHPSTRVIIDANEYVNEKPPRLLSVHEYNNSVKLLIGMSPNGLITYLSPCARDFDSDRQVNERSSKNDEIVDKGMNVQDIFLSHGIKVGSTLSKKTKVIPDILTKQQKFANKKVHVERILEMLKSYKILTQPMNRIEAGLSSEIAFIVAMLVNFRSNIMI